MKPATFAAIGECMIELSGRDGDLWRMGFAGDTFNTAWYARAILPGEVAVAYVTALGDDPFSQRMRGFIGESGVAVDRIRAAPGRRPGLYAITLQEAERTFSYWRGESAARTLADDEDWLRQALSSVDMLYFSGITLGILSRSARTTLLAELGRQRRNGARIAFDTNFRSALWPDLDEARAAMAAACAVADIVLPSFDDEAMLFGDSGPAATASRIAAQGVGEIVVKNGSGSSLVVSAGFSVAIPPCAPEQVIDTTGAGDSFAGAYLAARSMGKAPDEAARLGHAVASQVVGVRGALAEVDRRAAFAAAETA